MKLNRELMMFLFLTLAAVVGRTATVTLAWDAPSDPTIVGYRIYYGLSGRAYDYLGLETRSCCSGTVPNLYPGTTYYFTARSFNLAGIESDNSNEVRWTVTLPAPAQLQILRQASLVVIDVYHTTNLMQWNRVDSIVMTNTVTAPAGAFKAVSRGY